MIRTAIIGYGMSARTFHLPFITRHPAYRLTAIVSRQSELDLAAHPHARHYPDLDSLLADDACDLVVITTPNTLHYPQARQCLEAGKHIVLEKPMTIALAEAEALIALAERQQRHLSVYHNCRLNGDFLTVQKLLAANRLGQIRTVRLQWDRFRPEVRDRWRENAGPGSGIWYDLGPHMVDQALILFGMPEAVSARIRALRPQSPSDDYAHVQLHYPAHEVILHTAPYSTAPTPRFTLEGDGGNYRKYGLDPQEAQLKSGMDPRDAAFGHEDPAQHGLLYYPDGRTETIPTERGRFIDYYDNLAAAIHGKAALAVQPAQALDVMRILLLAHNSARQGKTLSVVS